MGMGHGYGHGHGRTCSLLCIELDWIGLDWVLCGVGAGRVGVGVWGGEGDLARVWV